MTDSMGNPESQPLWTNIRAAFMAAMKLCDHIPEGAPLAPYYWWQPKHTLGGIGVGRAALARPRLRSFSTREALNPNP